MSDCGTALFVTRTEGALVTADANRIQAFAEARKAEGTWADGMGNLFSFAITNSQRDDGQPEVAIKLSEYWVEDEEQSEFAAEMIEMDREPSEQLKSALQEELGPGFAVELYAGDW